MANNCKIRYNNGNPVGVTTENGKESTLFRKILNHPTIKNFEEALGIYKNVKSEKLSKNIFITPATVRSLDIKTENLKTLTEEYAKLTKDLLNGNLDNKNRFLSLQEEILKETQDELEKKLNSLNGVSVSFGSPYIGSWEGNYEPSLNMVLTVTDSFRDVENILYNLAEATSQDAFIVEEESEIEGTPLTEFTEDGFMHYPQTKVTFERDFTVEEKAELAQKLNDKGFSEFSIDGNYFIISHINFEENEQERIRAYKEQQTNLQGLFQETGTGIGQNKVTNYEDRNRKSKYIASKNEGDETTEQRKYDRNQIFKDEVTLSQKDSNYSFWQRADGKIYSSYREALQTGAEEIEIGFFDNSGNFYPIKTINPKFDETTVEGFINSFIKQGILSDVKEDLEGISYFQPNGYSQAAKGVNSLVLREQLLVQLGWQKFRKTPNGYTFDTEQIDNLKGNESIIEQEIRNILSSNSSLRDSPSSKQKLDENELKVRLLDLLNSLGVDLMSMADYVSKYKIKNGVEPSAKALADIANKVVAYQGGNISIQDLTEEVAHFIVEGWSQEDIDNLLLNIHKTPEWNQFAEEYRKVYSKKYKGDELEQVVRREILGKVLANSLLTSFSVENIQGTHKNIIEKLKELFNKFIDFIRGRVTNNKVSKLESFTDEVNDLFYSNVLSDYLNQDNYDNNGFVLYSTNNASSEIKGMRANIIESLKIVHQNIQRFSKSSTNIADKNSIERNITNLRDEQKKSDLLEQKQAIIELLSVATSQVNELGVIFDSANKEGLVYGTEENARLENLTKNLLPLLGGIKENLKRNSSKYPKRDWKGIIDTIESTQSSILDLESKASNTLDDIVENDLVDRMILKNNLPESYREHVKNWLIAAKHDTSLFHRHFGQITNSRDPLLGMASDIIERITNGSNREFVNNIKSFQNRLESLGISPKELKQLSNNGYLLDIIDHAELEQNIAKKRAESRLEATGKNNYTDKDVDDVIKKEEANELDDLSIEEQKKFDEILSEKMADIIERPFLDSYYKKRDEKYEDLKIDKHTKDQIKAYSATRSSLLLKAKRNDGTVDWSVLSLAEEEQLKALNRRRKRDSSLFDTDGNLKLGIEQVYSMEDVPQKNVDDKTFVEVGGIFYYVNDSSVIESRIAIDLNKLNNSFFEENKGKTVNKNKAIERFLNEVRLIEFGDPSKGIEPKGKKAAKRFIDLNSSLLFSNSFWDNVSGGKSYTETVIDYINNTEEEVDRDRVFEIINTIKSLNNKRSNILKQFRVIGKPFETDTTAMGSIPKKTLIEIDEELQQLYRQLSDEVSLPESDEVVDPVFVSGANEAFLEEVSEESMTYEEELEFIFNNSTDSSRDRVSKFKRGIDRFLSGKSQDLTPSQVKFIDSVIDNINEETELLHRTESAAKTLTILYARTQLASYYKRLTPSNYDSLEDNRENMSETSYLETLIEDENIDVTPNYSFMEDGENNLNPNYDSNYEGGIQPKHNMFRSAKYVDTFRPDNQGNATTNKKLFNALQELKNLQRESLKNYGLESRSNLYKLPQITKKGVDRSVDFIKRVGRGGVKQSLKELSFYRREDIAYGENIKGENIYTIPTYYVRNLENKEELSEELYYTYAMMYQQSVLHKHRKNNVGEMLAIKDAIGKRDQPKGKSVDTTNTMRMFKNYMDYSIFGVQESQEFKINILGESVDLTKIARVLLNFVKFRNLAFSPLVAATSWLTGEVNIQIEKNIGQILNSSSERLGRKEFAKLAFEATKEVGKFNSKSKLNILGEYFGVFDLINRFEGSNYNWAARNLTMQKLGFGVHQIANFPIGPRMMMSVLHDYRVVDGVIQNFSQYKRSQKKNNPKKTTKEIKAEWKAFEGDVIYKYIKVKDGNVSFDPSILSKLNKSIRNQEYLNYRMEAINKAVRNAVTLIDQQITPAQKVAAQRHFVMNYLMTHRSWLSIVVSNRTKNAHYNLNSGEYEEGSYRTFAHFSRKAIKGFLKDKNMQSLKDLWNGKDIEPDGEASFGDLLEMRRRNMRRVMLDSVWAFGLGALAYMLMGLSDDDDDNYMMQLSSYMTMRVLNETVSSSSGLPIQFYEVLKSPFVGLSVLQQAVSTPLDFFDSEPIKSGTFKGYSQLEKDFIKLMPGFNVAHDISNLQDHKKNYWYYQKTNIRTSPAIIMELFKEDDK